MTIENSDKKPNIIRIAIASENGQAVDQHFARTPLFTIYDIVDNVPHFIEQRKNPVRKCFCNGENEEEIFKSIVQQISDCQFVVALRIGSGALSYLVDMGIRAAQIDDSVENALHSIISSGKLKHLFRRQERI